MQSAKRFIKSKNALLDIVQWKEYCIGDIFNASNTGNVLQREICDGTGTTPYVTASGINNGISAYVNASKHKLITGNCILVGGKTFTLTYQKDDFISNDSHNFEMHLAKNIGNSYVYLFLISVLRTTLSQRYTWGDAVTKERILSDEILLPANGYGNPDYTYMENYMKDLEAKVHHTIDCFSKCLL